MFLSKVVTGAGGGSAVDIATQVADIKTCCSGFQFQKLQLLTELLRLYLSSEGAIGFMFKGVIVLQMCTDLFGKCKGSYGSVYDDGCMRPRKWDTE